MQRMSYCKKEAHTHTHTYTQGTGLSHYINSQSSLSTATLRGIMGNRQKQYREAWCILLLHRDELYRLRRDRLSSILYFLRKCGNEDIVLRFNYTYSLRTHKNWRETFHSQSFETVSSRENASSVWWRMHRVKYKKKRENKYITHWKNI